MRAAVMYESQVSREEPLDLVLPDERPADLGERAHDLRDVEGHLVRGAGQLPAAPREEVAGDVLGPAHGAHDADRPLGLGDSGRAS
jgi:hypothetical protein